jgi:hypothetical protein
MVRIRDKRANRMGITISDCMRTTVEKARFVELIGVMSTSVILVAAEVQNFSGVHQCRMNSKDFGVVGEDKPPLHRTPPLCVPAERLALLALGRTAASRPMKKS